MLVLLFTRFYSRWRLTESFRLRKKSHEGVYEMIPHDNKSFFPLAAKRHFMFHGFANTPENSQGGDTILTFSGC
jgi:hypothetical protein